MSFKYLVLNDWKSASYTLINCQMLCLHKDIAILYIIHYIILKYSENFRYYLRLYGRYRFDININGFFTSWKFTVKKYLKPVAANFEFHCKDKLIGNNIVVQFEYYVNQSPRLSFYNCSFNR